MLVATSLIEVGIDVPNATVMIVEGAERFGLAQLHQLRGRVGRGTAKSLLPAVQQRRDGRRPGSAWRRCCETTDGFELADRDLEIRGEGQVMGARQAGVPDLKLATPGARPRRPAARPASWRKASWPPTPRSRRPVNAPLRDAVQRRLRDRAGLAAQGVTPPGARRPRILLP